MKIIMAFFVVIVISMESLNPLRLKLINKVDDIIAGKKIAVRFEFDQEDMAVYSDSMRFSVDSASVELKSWKGVTTPISEYIPLFRKNKLVYLNSFDVDIVLDFNKPDKGLQQTILQESNLYLACLTLSKDGKNRSKNLVVALARPVIDEPVVAPMVNVASEEKMHYSMIEPEVNQVAVVQWQDDTVFNKLFETWWSFVAKLYDFLGSEAFIISYIGLFFIVCFSLLMRTMSWGQLLFYDTAWKRELIQFMGVLWATCNFYFLTIFFLVYVVLLLMALFFFIVGLYYLKDKYHQKSWLTTIRTTIGMALIILVLPIIVKAYLLKNVLLK